jgi:hypothetical protein
MLWATALGSELSLKDNFSTAAARLMLGQWEGVCIWGLEYQGILEFATFLPVVFLFREITHGNSVSKVKL